MDKDTNTSMEIIGRLLENDDIATADMRKTVDLLVDTNGVLTLIHLSTIESVADVFDDDTGATG